MLGKSSPKVVAGLVLVAFAVSLALFMPLGEGIHGNNMVSDSYPPVVASFVGSFSIVNNSEAQSISSGDFDGDGIQDLVIMAKQDLSGISGDNITPIAYVFYGPIDSSNGYNTSVNNADAAFYMGRNRSSSGVAIGFSTPKRYGDLDGDGYDDFVFGDSTWFWKQGYSPNGSTYIIYGSNTRFSGSHNITNPSVYDALIYGKRAGSSQGGGTFLNVTNDQYDDLAISASDSQYGTTYIIEGESTRLSGIIYNISTVANLTIEGDAISGASAVWLGGDINGDSFNDLVLYATPGINKTLSIAYGPYTDWGWNTAVNSTNITNATVWSYQQSSIDRAYVADVDNDGKDDLLIGDYWHSSANTHDGKVYLVYGNISSGVNDTLENVFNASWYGEGYNENLGQYVSIANVNNDSYLDILIGGFHNIGPTSVNKAYLVYGKPNRFSGTSSISGSYDARWYASQYWDQMGSRIYGSDLDGDGQDEVVISAYDWDSSSKIDIGKVFVLDNYGGSPNTTHLAVNTSTDLNRTTEGLLCYARGVDANDLTIRAYYQWWNGTKLFSGGWISVSNDTVTLVSTLGSGNTKKGETWNCSVMMSDIASNDSAWNNGTVLILNTPPSQGVPSLTSTYGTNYIDENLTCSNTSTYDADGDHVNNTIVWYQNGSVRPDLENATLVLSGNTTEDDTWRCNITPHDDEGPGISYNSTERTIKVLKCGDTLYRNMTLSRDITGSGTCLTLGANNIMLDCSGYSITGDGTGSGISMASRSGAVVEGCNVSGFFYGIFVSGTYSSVIRNSTFNDSSSGIYVQSSSGNLFSNNTMLGNNNSIYVRNSLDSNFTRTMASGNAILEDTTYGMINYTHRLNLTRMINLTRHVVIASNFTKVNSSQLNDTAVISQYGVGISYPEPLWDPEDDGTFTACPASVCQNVSYSGSTYMFNASHFTSYSSQDYYNCLGQPDGNWTIASDTVISSSVYCRNINVTNGANLYANSSVYNISINLTADDSVVIEPGSAINATGQGYLGGHSNSALNGEGPGGGSLAQATGAKGGEPFHWRAETGTAPPSSPVAWAQAGALQAQTSTEATEEGP